MPVSAIIAAVSAAVAFSFFIVLMPLVYQEGGNPQSVVFFRLLSGFAAFTVAAIIYRRRLFYPTTYRPYIHLLFFGISLGMMGGFYVSSVYYIPVSLAIIIFYTWPFFSAILAPLFGGEWPGLKQMLPLCILFLCLIPAIGPQWQELDIIGVFLALGAAISLSLYMAFSNLAAQHMHHYLLGMGGSAIGLCLAVAFIFLAPVGQGMPHGFVVPFSLDGQLILLAACMFFAIGLGAQVISARIARPEKIAIFYNFEPVVTLILANILLGEKLTPIQYAAASAIIGILIVYSFLKRKAKRK